MILDDVLGYRPAVILCARSAADLDEPMRNSFAAADVQIIDAPGLELEAWLNDNECMAVLIGADRNILGTAVSAADIPRLHPEKWTYPKILVGAVVHRRGVGTQWRGIWISCNAYVFGVSEITFPTPSPVFLHQYGRHDWLRETLRL